MNNVPIGGGFASAYAILGTTGDWGYYSFSMTASITCTGVGGYLVYEVETGSLNVPGPADSITFSNVEIDELGNGSFTVSTGGSGQSKPISIAVQPSSGSAISLYSGSVGIGTFQLQFLENQQDHVPAGSYAALLATYGAASASTQINLAIIAIPVNFRKTAQGANGQPPNGPGPGLIAFQYAWDSSTRTANDPRAGDLAACIVGESVWYPGPGPTYQWRIPPYHDPATGNTVSTNNPNDASVIINPRPGPALALEDVHHGVEYLMPAATYDPGAAHDFITEQVYAFRCQNYQGGNAQAFTGHLIITRTVSQNGNGTWKYEIYKDSQTGTLNPIP